MLKARTYFEKEKRIKKSIFILLALFIFFVPHLYATQDKWNKQLWNSVRFAEDGNTRIFDFEQTKLSLANGASPNWIKTYGKKDNSILSHFIMSISYSEDPNTYKQGVEIVELLFEHGAKLQYCDGTILYFPVVRGRYEIVKLLLENGSSATFWPKAGIGDDITPIEVATEGGHEKIIDLLVSYGAEKVNKKEAIQARFIESAYYGSISELKELIKKGAKVNRRNRQEETALLHALSGSYHRYDFYLKVVFLLDSGADVNQEGEGRFGKTYPLHEAVLMSSFLFNANRIDTFYAEETLQQLIKRGAYIATEDEKGMTPLHIAAEHNNIYAAELLLKTGTKVMPKDKSGKTPLDYAKSSEIIKLLKEYGAKEQ